MSYTEQESFWSGEFGDKYVDRNSGFSTINHFSKILLNNRIKIQSVIELGSNVGINLDSLKAIYPDCKTFGVEINKKAYQILSKNHDSYLGSIYDFKATEKYDLAFTYGVLIHQNPIKLDEVYSKLFSLSSKYILICETISHDPVMVSYRGNDNKLFKRDFGKEFWEKYPDLKLIDYGFFWSMDDYTRSGDANWFLFKK